MSENKEFELEFEKWFDENCERLELTDNYTRGKEAWFASREAAIKKVLGILSNPENHVVSFIELKKLAE